MSVRTERCGRVATIVIDRPACRNAVDGPTAAALAGAFRDFDVDDSLDIAVLWGAGGTFCAGADLKAVAQEPARANRVAPDGVGPMRISRLRLSKPVIAAVAGHAVAGGLELAAWCDLRVVEESAVFGVFCRRWGVPLIDGGTVRLPRLIGMSHALDMILTGRAVGAPEALARSARRQACGKRAMSFASCTAAARASPAFTTRLARPQLKASFASTARPQQPLSSTRTLCASTYSARLSSSSDRSRSPSSVPTGPRRTPSSFT